MGGELQNIFKQTNNQSTGIDCCENQSEHKTSPIHLHHGYILESPEFSRRRHELASSRDLEKFGEHVEARDAHVREPESQPGNIGFVGYIEWRHAQWMCNAGCQGENLIQLSTRLL